MALARAAAGEAGGPGSLDPRRTRAALGAYMDDLSKRMSLRLREMEMALTVQACAVECLNLHSARYCRSLRTSQTAPAIAPACAPCQTQTQAEELPTVESTALAAAVGTLEGTVNEVRHDLTQLHELAKVDQQVTVCERDTILIQ